jgi:hypothetical protein
VWKPSFQCLLLRVAHAKLERQPHVGRRGATNGDTDGNHTKLLRVSDTPVEMQTAPTLKLTHTLQILRHSTKRLLLENREPI